MARTSADRKKQAITSFRRSEILAAATDVFGAKGYAGTRMDDVAARADLTKATLYAYFGSKDAIYEAVVAEAVEDLHARIKEQVDGASGFAAKLDAYINARVNYWHEKQSLYRVISNLSREMPLTKRNGKWLKRAVDYLVSIFRDAASEGEIPEQNFALAAWALLDILRGLQERRLIYQESAGKEDVPTLVDFVLRAVRYRGMGDASAHEAPSRRKTRVV